jgi:hypothetical protein
MRKCGNGVSCGLRREGERLVFFDDLESSKTYGEQIACCPRCGARLDHHLLLQAARLIVLSKGLPLNDL